MKCCSSVPGFYCELKLAVMWSLVILFCFILSVILIMLASWWVSCSVEEPKDLLAVISFLYNLFSFFFLIFICPLSVLNGNSENSSYYMAIRVCSFLKPFKSSCSCELLLCWKCIVITSFKRTQIGDAKWVMLYRIAYSLS